MTNDRRTTTRRGFLDWFLALGSVIAGLAMAIPGMMYLWPAARGGASGNVEIKGADSMSPGASKIVQIGGKAVIVIRRRQEEFVAYSAICTHLGCLVTWDAVKKEFFCPCHAGVFDAEGRVVSGPPPAPLPEYAVKSVDGRVFVSAT